MFNANKYLISLLERFVIIAVTILLVFIMYSFKLNIFLFKEIGVFFSNILSFVSILLGIVITMATLFLGYSNKQVVKRIKLRSADKLMFKYFLVPIFTGLITSVGSICLSLMAEEKVLTIPLQLQLTIIYVGLLIIFFLSTIRIFLLMLMVLKDVFEEDIREQESEKSDVNNSNKSVVVNFDNDAFK